MENYLKDFEVENKNPLEKAIRRWRNAIALVKSPRRRFRFVADLARRSVAEKKKLQIQGSDDYNPGESLLPSDSPHAYTDYDERGKVATSSDDSNRRESLLPSVSSHANTNYGKQGNVANVVGSDDSNLSESLLPNVSPQANMDLGEPGNQTAVGSDDSNRSESLLPSVSSHANTNYGEQGNVANVVGSDDSNLNESLLPSVSPQANMDLGKLGNQTTTVGSDDSNRSESLLPSVSSHANTNYGEQGNVANLVDSDDSNLSESLLPSVSPQANTDFGEPGNQTTTVDRSSSNVAIGVADENNNFNHPRHGTRVTILQWIFMLNGLSLEMLSAYFDQLSSPTKSHYALVSLLLAIAAVLTCTLEVIHNGRKEGVESTNGKVLGTLLDIFGLGLSLIQCICSAVQYHFLHRHENNPMKVSPVPLFFFFCLVVLKLKMN